MTTEELQTLLDNMLALPGYLSDAATVGDLASRREEALRIYSRHAPTIAAELIAARSKLAAAEGALQEVAHFKPGAADHPMMIALSMAGIAQAALDAMEAAK